MKSAWKFDKKWWRLIVLDKFESDGWMNQQILAFLELLVGATKIKLDCELHKQMFGLYFDKSESKVPAKPI